LYVDELDRLARDGVIEVAQTVDRAGPEWLGRVGVVTQVIDRLMCTCDRTVAFICGPERMMQATVDVLHERGVPDERIWVTLERHMDCGVGLCGHCQLGAQFVWQGRAGLLARRTRPVVRDRGPVMAERLSQRRPRVGVVKFSSCDGCQLTLLDLEEELLAITERFEIVEFAEATSNRSNGPFDVLLVEGSISTAEQAEEIVKLRRQATTLVTIGACATSGGIQALRNLGDHDAFRSARLSAAGMDRRAAQVSARGRFRGGRRGAVRLPHLRCAAARAAYLAGRRSPSATTRRGGLRRMQATGQPVHPRGPRASPAWDR